MNKIFLAFPFTPKAGRPVRDLVGHIGRLVASHGLVTVTGESLGGNALTPAIQQRIKESDALVALFTRENKVAGKNAWLPTQWVQGEITSARARGQRAIALVENGVKIEGPFAENERIELDIRNPLPSLLQLSETIGGWKEEAGRFLLVRLLPEAAAALANNGNARCKVRLVPPQGAPGAWQDAVVRTQPGGVFLAVSGVKEDVAIDVEIADGNARWEVRRIPAMGPCRIEERAMTLKIVQSAAPIVQSAGPKNSTYWDWSVWIDGTDAELDGIKEVTWKLHPSFSPSVYRSSSRSEKFKLNSSGWGEFTIYAEVKNKNGKLKSLRHWLTLGATTKSETDSPIATTLTHKPKSKGSQPAVFLSYSLNNANLAAHLTQALEKKKFTVTRDIDVAQGVEVNRWIKDQINKSDAVILLGAEEVGSYSNTEIQFAQSAGVPVIPVTLGASRKRPPFKTGDFTPLNISDGSPKKVAPGLAQKLSKLLP